MIINKEIDKISDSLEEIGLKIKNIENFNYYLYQELQNINGNLDTVDRLYSLSIAINDATDKIKTILKDSIDSTLKINNGGK